MRIERILFIRTDRMGDVLMNLPAVHRLRQNFPKAWITWMVDRAVAPLLRDHPDVDEIFEIDARKLREENAYRKQLIQHVRKIRFDVGIASNADKFFHWMLFAAGVRLRAGWRRKWSFLLNRKLSDDKAHARRHETQSNLALAGLIASKPWDGTWHLPVEEAALRAVKKRLNEEFGSAPVVAVHAGTSDPAKRWPLERFDEVCRALLKAGRERIVLIGGSEEEAQSRRLLSRLPEGAKDWTGALDLQELSALLASSQVRTLLSVDSGPVHVAWLHRKPVVALYAKNAPGSDPARWGPLSQGSVAIHKEMKEISAEEVRSALEAVLAR